MEPNRHNAGAVNDACIALIIHKHSAIHVFHKRNFSVDMHFLVKFFLTRIYLEKISFFSPLPPENLRMYFHGFFPG